MSVVMVAVIIRKSSSICMLGGGIVGVVVLGVDSGF